MQDINPSEKRSIRNISIDRPQTLSGGDNGGVQTPPPPPSQPLSEPPMAPFPQRYRRENKKWVRMGIWGGAILVCAIALFVIIGSFFEGATVTVTPRHAPVSLAETLKVGLSEGENIIPYDEVSVSIEEKREVAATGEEKVERAASGRIVVYNDFDGNSQKLIKNTRFETPDGLIYRIRESVTVPGQHKGADGKTVPGSIEVEVFADSPGEQYNIGLTDFTIPGFKENNDPRFDKFYARSKTPMEGGFIGTVRTAADSVTTATRTELKDALTAKSASALTESMPQGFVIIPETMMTTFEDLPNADGSKEDTVVIGMKASVRAIALDSNVLAEAVARTRVPDYAGEQVRFLDPGSVTLATANPVSIAELPETFDVSVSGSGTLVWVIDAEALRQDLVGVHKSLAEAVFKRHAAIQKADLVVKPFWRRSLPDDPEAIEIVESTKEFSS